MVLVSSRAGMGAASAARPLPAFLERPRAVARAWTRKPCAPGRGCRMREVPSPARQPARDRLLVLKAASRLLATVTPNLSDQARHVVPRGRDEIKVFNG